MSIDYDQIIKDCWKRRDGSSSIRGFELKTKDCMKEAVRQALEGAKGRARMIMIDHSYKDRVLKKSKKFYSKGGYLIKIDNESIMSVMEDE